MCIRDRFCRLLCLVVVPFPPFIALVQFRAQKQNLLRQSLARVGQKAPQAWVYSMIFSEDINLIKFENDTYLFFCRKKVNQPHDMEECAVLACHMPVLSPYKYQLNTCRDSLVNGTLHRKDHNRKATIGSSLGCRVGPGCAKI
eukprot:1235287-Amphidinium_carterae.1